MEMRTEKSERLGMAIEVVVAFLSRNPTTVGEVAELIKSVHTTIEALAGREARILEREARIAAREARVAERETRSPEPAVPLADSIKSDRLVCLECGREQKSLKMHLERAHGLTTQSYRGKWGLPGDYPMVAPNLSARRSALAHEVNLGVRRRGVRFRASN